MVKNVYLIESAKDLLNLLDTNLSKYNEKELSNLYNRWIHTVIEVYNNKAELILFFLSSLQALFIAISIFINLKYLNFQFFHSYQFLLKSLHTFQYVS